MGVETPSYDYRAAKRELESDEKIVAKIVALLEIIKTKRSRSAADWETNFQQFPHRDRWVQRLVTIGFIEQDHPGEPPRITEKAKEWLKEVRAYLSKYTVGV